MKQLLSKQIGLSLIELLVALAIASFLFLWLAVSSGQTGSTSRLVFELLKLESNGQIGLKIIGNTVKGAGYRHFDLETGFVDPAAEYPFVENIFEAGQVINSVDASIVQLTGVQKAGTDNIVVRIKGDEFSQLHDCMGDPITPGQIVTMIFYVAENQADPLNQNELMCKVDNLPADIVATNIQNMIVKFGVSDPLGGQVYKEVAIMDAQAGDFQNITSLNIALVAESDKLPAESKDYVLLDSQLSSTSPNLSAFYTAHIPLYNRGF